MSQKFRVDTTNIRKSLPALSMLSQNLFAYWSVYKKTDNRQLFAQFLDDLNDESIKELCKSICLQVMHDSDEIESILELAKDKNDMPASMISNLSLEDALEAVSTVYYELLNTSLRFIKKK